MRRKLFLAGIMTSAALVLTHAAAAHNIPHFDLEGANTSPDEHDFISRSRQLTFSGLRSGEGYFSSDGRYMIFQSERHPNNPFYQIYLTDLETGKTERVSPGKGMTTCAWIHPKQKKVMFSSTHLDPLAEEKMAAEYKRRESGGERPYSWDFDETFDIFETDFQGKKIKNLTDKIGYDAEGDWSPDGSQIVFASNRSGYEESLSPEEAAVFKKDPSYMMDIYIMNADGSNVRRLTSERGYDGGPFFSADGQKITWRHFAEDGRSAEIYTMNVDGSDKKQLTNLGTMSWAPYFHPSGDYLIFTTSLLGHHNFELYIVDAEGAKDPVRVSYTDGFDGLPVFSPNGREIAWTTTRGEGKGGQIFIGNWNDAKARRMLDLPSPPVPTDKLEASISEADLKRHVEFLASPTLEGRMTGHAGARKATDYAAHLFADLGLKAEAANSYFQNFEFTAGVSLESTNELNDRGIKVELNQDWRPVSFSKSGKFAANEFVFAGYGIVAPKSGDFEPYNSYKGLDVKNKWVVAFRYSPNDVDKDYRRYLSRHATLRRKAMLARDLGAAGIVFVSGPESSVNEQLVRLEFDASMQGAGIFSLSLTDQLISRWLGEDLRAYQQDLDKGRITTKVFRRKVSGRVQIRHDRKVGRNVIARLQVGEQPSPETIIIGAHIDHLGMKINPETNAIEVYAGADDNASGTAALLEIAQALAAEKRAGSLNLRRDIIFALWSGEELGLLGSDHFMKQYEHDHGRPYPKISAYLNMDMIGRFENKLVFQGTGSSVWWKKTIESLNMRYRMPLVTQEDPYLPTDSTSFYLRGVPTLNAFTGAHDDYHKPSDTPDKINYEGLETVASFMREIAESLAASPDAPPYVKVPQANQSTNSFRVYLGTIPDYTNTSAEGVVLNGVKPQSPSAKAGLASGDIIVRLDGTKISNIYDYTYVLAALRVNETVEIEILRAGKRLTLKITPTSRT